MNDDAQAYTRQGIALVNQGLLADSVAYFQEAVRLAPDDAHVYNNLANVYLFQDRYDEAIANYRCALELQPDNPGFHSHLSYAYSKKGSGPEAEESARQALWLRPDFADAHNHLGIALGLQEKYDDAEIAYREALRLEPGLAKAHSNLAQLHLLQHRYDDALARAQTAIELNPNLAEAYATQAAILLHENRLDEALASCRYALQLNPQLPEAHYQLATAYMKEGHLDEAVAVSREFQRLRPDHPDMEYILGMVALKENRLEDALASFNALLRKKPDNAQVHFNRALVWLVQGNYEEGWPEYEWRWRWKDFVVQPHAQPVWDGSPLDGKTIYLHAEQGLGDALQFIRYAALVKSGAWRERVASARGALRDNALHSPLKVVVGCPAVLLKILGRCPGIDRLVARETFTEQVDEHASLMTLPSILKTSLATIPATVPYIFPDPALVESWRAEMTAWPEFKIGIAWQGSPQHPDDRHRSFPLADAAPLGQVPGIRWFSLQKGPGQEQVAEAPFELIDLGQRLDVTTGAFMDTAALMMSLNLVITSDTAIAHLAGGLGVPVWVALQFAPDFRWFLGRDDSPWYLTMRLFRQNRRGDWRELFERMASELLVKSRHK